MNASSFAPVIAGILSLVLVGCSSESTASAASDSQPTAAQQRVQSPQNDGGAVSVVAGEADTAPWAVRWFARKSGSKGLLPAGLPLQISLSTGEAASFDISVGADDAATGATPPFVFAWSGGSAVAASPPYVTADDGAISLPAGLHSISITDGSGQTANLRVRVRSDTSQALIDITPQKSAAATTPIAPMAPHTGSYKLQAGPWFPTPWNAEMPFINVLHATETYLCAQSDCKAGVRTDDYYEAGAVDPVTLLPQRILGGGAIHMQPLLTSASDSSGDWVVTWEGDADITIHGLSRSAQRRINNNRIEFKRRGRGLTQVKITHIGKEGLKSLAVYRKSDEAAYNAGKIYTDEFLAMIGKNHIVRSMDLQYAYRALETSIDDVATMETLNWGNMAWNAIRGWPHPKRSLPLKALFELAVAADVELWAHGPIALGSQTSVRVAGGPDAWVPVIAGEKDAIWQSNEWARYYDAFVAELIASGYPEDRTLYLTVSNEIWNFSGAFKAATQYAAGIGRGVKPKGRDGKPLNYGHRIGYGALTAKTAIEFDAALKRAGRNQNVIFVVEAQAANPSTTADALRHYKAEIERQSKDWNAYAARSTVAVASYWGGTQIWENLYRNDAQRIIPNWSNKATMQALRDRYEVEIRRDPAALMDRLEDAMVNNRQAVVANKTWVLQKLKAHDAEARKFGMRLGALYEGGPHDDEPRPFWRMFGQNTDRVLQFHREFGAAKWGQVNNIVNDAIIEAFPGIILANYGTVGRYPENKQPWFDGLYGQNTPMQQSWARYHRRP